MFFKLHCHKTCLYLVQSSKQFRDKGLIFMHNPYCTEIAFSRLWAPLRHRPWMFMMVSPEGVWWQIKWILNERIVTTERIGEVWILITINIYFVHYIVCISFIQNTCQLVLDMQSKFILQTVTQPSIDNSKPLFSLLMLVSFDLNSKLYHHLE